MGRSPCCDNNGLKKGTWTPEEDHILVNFIEKYGHRNWTALPKRAGLNRCGKSCRLRWNNYLRPGIKRGNFTNEEEQIIINLHSVIGNKWSKIASHLPRRTDNEIKNFWNTNLRKKLLHMGIDPSTHKSIADLSCLVNLSRLMFASSSGSAWENALRLQAKATQVTKIQLLHNIFQAMNMNLIPSIEETNLVASQILMPPNNGIMDLVQAQSMFPNAGLTPEPEVLSGNYHASMGSPKGFDGGIFSPDNQYMDSLIINSNSTNTESLFLQQAPVMAHGYTMNQMEIENQTYCSTNSLLNSNVEEWKKLLEDESCSTFWKDIIG